MLSVIPRILQRKTTAVFRFDLQGKALAAKSQPLFSTESEITEVASLVLAGDAKYILQ